MKYYIIILFLTIFFSCLWAEQGDGVITNLSLHSYSIDDNRLLTRKILDASDMQSKSDVKWILTEASSKRLSAEQIPVRGLPVILVCDGLIKFDAILYLDLSSFHDFNKIGLTFYPQIGEITITPSKGGGKVEVKKGHPQIESDKSINIWPPNK